MDYQDNSNTVLDENGNDITPLDDDYDYYKSIQLSPLDGDYCRYMEDI